MNMHDYSIIFTIILVHYKCCFNNNIYLLTLSTNWVISSYITLYSRNHSPPPEKQSVEICLWKKKKKSLTRKCPIREVRLWWSVVSSQCMHGILIGCVFDVIDNWCYEDYSKWLCWENQTSIVVIHKIYNAYLGCMLGYNDSCCEFGMWVASIMKACRIIWRYSDRFNIIMRILGHSWRQIT